MMTARASVVSIMPDPHPGPWYRTSKFWKRCSVFVAIFLSAASLVISSIASLGKEGEKAVTALKIAGVVINSISIMLSAGTSLNWMTKATSDRLFAVQLMEVSHEHDGDSVKITNVSVLGSDKES